MKTAIVLGATGLVGSHLVEQLVQEDVIERVVAITRRPIEYTSPKVVNKVVEFEVLENYRDTFQGDMLFSCLGTTIKRAGSLDAQRKVDLDYQYQTAKLASENGVSHYLLVSSSGAKSSSGSPYFKMKGELEEKVALLPFERISIFQPSLLMGNRNEFRLGEKIGSWIMPALCALPPLKRYRPIHGGDVAKKMIAVACSSGEKRELFQLDELFL